MIDHVTGPSAAQKDWNRSDELDTTNLFVDRRTSPLIVWPAGTEHGVLDLDVFAGPQPLPPLVSSGAELLAELTDALDAERAEFSGLRFGIAA